MNVIQIENLWKEYRLGVIGHGTLIRDLQSWWAKTRGKEDPNALIAPIHKGQEAQIEGDRFWALRDINLEIKQGEVLGIIGRNGAGKSTLLKILSRVTAPTKGCVKIKGRIASLLEVGTGFHEELTGRENIFMNGSILGMSKHEIQKKLDEIVDFSGVENFIDTPVKRYSSGMRVRLAFAVAAHLEPEILIVDEVLAVGDSQFQKKCLGKMEKVGKEGRTVLFVSHNMGIIKNLCLDSILLESGTIRYYGQTGKAVSKYLGTQNIKGNKLSDRADRQGSQEFQFDEYRLEDHEGNTVDYAVCGMPLKIKVYYSACRPLKNVNVGITINSEERLPLSLMASPHTQNSFDIIPSKGCFMFDIPNLPISQGLYSLDLASNSNGECLDRILGAFNLKINQGDYFDTGKNYPENMKFCLNHRIEIHGK